MPPEAPTAPPSPPPHAAPGQVPPGAAPSFAPAPTTPGAGTRRPARERLFGELRKRTPAGSGSAPDPAPPQPGVAPAPADGPPPEKEGAAPADGTPTPTETPPADKAKSDKVNPWRLVDNYKKRVAELEKQVSSGVNPEARKQYEERAAKAEARVKELEEEIRYVDYSKHPEFRSKYQEPYEKAWRDAITELSQLTITDPETEEQRPANANDMMMLVNAPLQKAREVANQLFGDFADDAMTYRKEIKRAFDAQAEALNNARKGATEREQKTKAELEEIQRSVGAVWEEANSSIKSDPAMAPFFAPIDGDDAANQALEKGYELADRAFGLNPAAPGLTKEQREEIVRLHAAVRNRAAAFGRMRHLIGQRDAKIAALEKELADFRGSAPGTGSVRGAQITPPTPGSAMDRVKAALRARAQ